LFVPQARTFPLFSPPSQQPGPLFAFPLFSALAVGVAVVAVGVARDALDTLDELAREKTPTGTRRTLVHRPHVQMERALAEAELGSARAFLYDTVAEVWAKLPSEKVGVPDRAALRLAATHAVRTSAHVVDRAYEAGGGTSIREESRLQRDFRDVHAITQHRIIAQPTLELAGRVMFGVETDVSQL
jgi:alkylation response protein AidB-like acyl-CoA dehydrogenase